MNLAIILSTFLKQERQKRGNITSLVTAFIDLAYEGIPCFYTTKDKRLYIKQFRLWKIKWIYNATESFIWKIQWSCMVYVIQLP